MDGCGQPTTVVRINAQGTIHGIINVAIDADPQTRSSARDTPGR